MADARVTFPGDVVSDQASSLLQGRGTYVDGDVLKASYLGTFKRVNQLAYVDPLHGKYLAQVGDVVVGVVQKIGGNCWYIDIGSSMRVQLSILQVNTEELANRRKLDEDVYEMRNIFDIGDVISCEVQRVSSNGTVLLQTRTSTYGRLTGGLLVKVKPNLLLRQSKHMHELKCGVLLILGCNALAVGGGDGVALDGPARHSLLLLRNDGVLANGRVGVGVHGLHVVLVDALPEEGGEVLLVLLRVLLLHLAHVVGDVHAHDAVTVGLGVVAGLLVLAHGVPREPLFAVRNVQTAVAGPLQGAKGLVSGGDNLDSDVEQRLERPPVVVLLLDVEDLSVGLLPSDELVVQLELGQEPAGEKEPGAVGRGVVGQSDLDAVVLQLSGVGGGVDLVTDDGGRDDLADDALVGEPDDEAVLGRCVLVLVLQDHAPAAVVVRLPLCVS
ncbi:exosome complex component RRP4, putative [Babesia caballi]|uniref:Exosome complex component RRP4, putative n=1 Tax=Babesia caballi TaxID=5871 RepID=A0AAV4LTE2_BABCB|nr:exosome complex component RRP4, putative [Babesia caballi]